MKALYAIVLLFVMISSGFTNQEIKTVKALFDYHDDGVYYFTVSNDEDEYETYTFEKIEKDALKAYDMTDLEYEGKTFNVTYKIETEINEFNDNTDVWVIVKLELVK